MEEEEEEKFYLFYHEIFADEIKAIKDHDKNYAKAMAKGGLRAMPVSHQFRHMANAIRKRSEGSCIDIEAEEVFMSALECNTP